GRSRGRFAVRQEGEGFRRTGLHRLGRSRGLLTSTARAAELLRQPLLERRPARRRPLQEGLRMGREGVAVRLPRKQIETLARDQPEHGVAGDRDAARQINRVVAAELRPVDIGTGDEGGAIALVVETPDDASLGGLELRKAAYGAGVDKIGDGIVTFDGKAREAVGNHALGGCSPGRRGGTRPFAKTVRASRQKACQECEQGYSAAKFNRVPNPVYFLPFCRHSCCG